MNFRINKKIFKFLYAKFLNSHRVLSVSSCSFFTPLHAASWPGRPWCLVCILSACVHSCKAIHFARFQQVTSSRASWITIHHQLVCLVELRLGVSNNLLLFTTSLDMGKHDRKKDKKHRHKSETKYIYEKIKHER